MSFWRKHWIEVAAAVVVVVVIHAFLFTGTFAGDHIDSTKASEFGDFITGYVGTIILAATAAFLCIQLRDQLSTNQSTAFETRFFELLKYHRENVTEIGIGEKTGRRIFVSMIREFRATLEIVGLACAEVDPAYPLIKKIDLAYMGFYYGVGPNSTRVLSDAVQDHPTEIVSRVIVRLEAVQIDCREYERNDTASRPMPKLLERISYVPFDGHQSRLGHYFRHLYQTVKYAENHAPKGKAEEYVGIIRAQLTNHEQALLCLNALSSVGSAWLRRGFLTNYSMIKNIPKGFFDPKNEIDLKKQFPTIHFEFEDTADPEVEANRNR